MSSLLAQLGLAHDDNSAPLPINVGEVERWGSAFAGGLLVCQGVARGRLSGLILTGLGAGLLYRGFTGHCSCYAKMGWNTRSAGQTLGVPAKAGLKYEHSVTVNASRQELYDFWRDLSNLPKIMHHIESVHEFDSLRSHWIAKGPMGIKVEWDAEILNEEPGRLIAWRSLPGGQVDTAGSVHFEEMGFGNGTQVRVSLKYNPPGGKIGANIAWLVGNSVESEIEADLCRFKKSMESGAFAGSKRL